ncbi:MAG: hypothetical protein WC464_08525, partial [Bdellovibrionales bacterium]
RAFGLRATQMTDLTPSPKLALMMECASMGLEPMQRLTMQTKDETGAPTSVLHQAVNEVFLRMDYSDATIKAASLTIVGAHSLRKAPRINAASLKARGIDDVAFEKIESYLPCVNSVRLAVTPWIIGTDYCRDRLKLSDQEMDASGFNLLKRLGFSAEDIGEADAFCYGFGTARNAKSLPLRHRPLFACGDEIPPEARLRMAQAVQSFISGDTGLVVRLPLSQSVEHGAKTALAAWRSGLKSLTIVFDPDVAAKPVLKSKARRIRISSRPMAKPVVAAKRSKSGKHGLVLTTRKPASIRRGAR